MKSMWPSKTASCFFDLVDHTRIVSSLDPENKSLQSGDAAMHKIPSVCPAKSDEKDFFS